MRRTAAAATLTALIAATATWPHAYIWTIPASLLAAVWLASTFPSWWKVDVPPMGDWQADLGPVGEWADGLDYDPDEVDKFRRHYWAVTGSDRERPEPLHIVQHSEETS